MKKKRMWILLVLVVVLAGCGAGRREAREREREAQERERAEAAERLLEGKVEVPDTYFKTQEAVEALFEAAGLKVEFVVSNFDEMAREYGRFLRTGECDEVDSSQAAITYFSRDEVGDLYGYYADIGATIIVGYSDHDYDGTVVEEVEVEEVVEENNVSEKQSDNARIPEDILGQLNDLNTKYDAIIRSVLGYIENPSTFTVEAFLRLETDFADLTMELEALQAFSAENDVYVQGDEEADLFMELLYQAVALNMLRSELPTEFAQ